MPLPKIEDARKLSDQELADEILAAKRELFELRLQKATRRLEKPHQFKHVRHRIAQMMTVEGERQRAAQQAEAQKTAAASPSVEPSQPDVQEEE
ncbi:MAG TPA: 50S ribosomal protein L29 [Cyanobacteria bacterium UBA8553]|nr:50S ribosomal protein L29 [Cyanobacteria bacterium UBA8553]HAJ62467.1 50S ribosomal protein L29 [Cyanobacteria bacterium UBA8543]